MLYLIDASIYIFRAWQTIPVQQTNTFEEPANAVKGFTHTLASILARQNPDYIACAFDDCGRNGKRNRIYPKYKADRPPVPDALRSQFARCRESAKALGIPCYGSEHVEADDIIGSFSKLAHSANIPVTIVSGDKDLAQFIRQGDIYWDFAQQQHNDERALRNKFKVRPDQIADWLAISGDKVDNIPGIPGVGPATAARLLNKWGNIDVLMQNADKVARMRFRGAPRVSKLLIEHAETVHLARRLTGHLIDSSLPDNIDTLRRVVRPAQAMQQDLQACGFSAEDSNELITLIQRERCA